MSRIKTYNLPDIIAVDVDEHGNSVSADPGVWVRHKNHKSSLGVVLSRAWGAHDKPMQVTVLWSIEPQYTFGNWPHINRVYPSMVSNQIVSIQPMTAPVGQVFYVNYTYPHSGSKP